MADIPRYPENRPVLIDDKPVLDDLFARLQPRLSEFTFANIFLFRHAHDYRIAMMQDSLVILGKGYGGESYSLPPLGGDRDEVARRLLQEGMTLYAVDEARVASMSGPGVIIEEDRDNFDYLYLRQDLAELSGNRFHHKKNRINYFATRYDYVTENYDQRSLPGCLDLLDRWVAVRERISPSLAPEAEAAREGLELAEALGLEGVVVTVAGQVKAFALGERLNDSTSVCHFEKGDPFVEGASQLVDREYNRLLFTDCTFTNREQDLGEEGLRSAKLSYRPVELVKKFRLRIESTL